MDRYAAGDDSAFGTLYDALAPRLYAFAVRKVRDRSRAEDLVQQTMLRLHLARGRFIRGSRVTPWAFAIIERLFLDTVRRKKLELLAPTKDAGVEAPSFHSGPEESALTKQVGTLVQRELSRLSAPQQQAFELVYCGQLSHAEAAELLGVTVASVKLRIQRANQAIRAALHAADAEWLSR